ncbi:EKC/KEOPS complex subunit TPRKB [Merluccius polli]|uniref:EKC/KEOPS complex subunit TPRKB n=1 Tax=Merluccius polli TaxID=89951 RepID=A0AA47NM46_MERPO|nr:EKC/KEOPS complex subunit TPRKB [Merluccius polli]
MHTSHQLELYPKQTVTQLLFKGVKNSAELRKSAMEGKINAALINPKMVRMAELYVYMCVLFHYALYSLTKCHPSQLVDSFQVLVAANKAVHLQSIGKMKTRGLYSEIIFNLSPANNISEAFKRFGISDSDDSVLVVLVATDDESQVLADITEKVDGQQVPVAELPTLTDVMQIRKLYKVTPQEEKIGSLLDSVVCRMATKDVV